MPKVEIKGQQLRIRIKSPKGAIDWGTHDIGRTGHLQRLAARYPKKGWLTQSYRLNLKDFKNFDDAENEIRVHLRNKKKITAKQYRDSLLLLQEYFPESKTIKNK